MQSSSWRFRQSYAERQQAYLKGASSSHNYVQQSSRTPITPKPKSVASNNNSLLFPPKGSQCPSTPPNTSRTRSETSLDDYRVLVKNAANGNHSDTESTDFEFETDSGIRNTSAHDQLEYRYLQEPSGQTSQYYRTSYNPVSSKKAPSDRGDAPKATTKSANKTQPKLSRSGTEKSKIDPSPPATGYQPIFGYIPAIVPSKCGPAHRTKSNHAGHGKQAKPSKPTLNLPRNY